MDEQYEVKTIVDKVKPAQWGRCDLCEFKNINHGLMSIYPSDPCKLCDGHIFVKRYELVRIK